MEKTIKLAIGKKNINIVLNNTKTAKDIIGILPLDARAQVWGNEIYFSIPLDNDLEDGKEIVDIGDVAYWPPGNAFCIFFGKTPESTSEKPKAASPVTVIGKIADKADIKYLKSVKQDQQIHLKPE